VDHQLQSNDQRAQDAHGIERGKPFNPDSGTRLAIDLTPNVGKIAVIDARSGASKVSCVGNLPSAPGVGKSSASAGQVNFLGESSTPLPCISSDHRTVIAVSVVALGAKRIMTPLIVDLLCS
jgi:hypothetical protein